jgi:ankyrin
MDDPQSLVTALSTGDAAALAEQLDRRPRLANTFLARPRPWGDEQWMPTHLAAAAGHPGLVDLLLQRGVHPDCRTRFNTPLHARQTPLHLAAAAGHAEVVDRLLEAAAEVVVFDAQRRSPLWLAARHQRPAVIQRLLRRGAPVDPPDAQGRTPLHAALLPPPPPEAAPPLPQEGSPAPSSTGRFPADPDPQPAPFDPAAALALLAAHADPNAVCPRDAEGYTPLHRCVSRGDLALPVAEALLAAGADPTAADPRFHRTPLTLAQHLDHPRYTQLFQ